MHHPQHDLLPAQAIEDSHPLAPASRQPPVPDASIRRSMHRLETHDGVTVLIRTENLTKHFGSHVSLDDLNLDVRPAEIYGFLGPNGAGKTTTIHLLLNLLRPTSGQAIVLGEHLKAGAFGFRRRIGVVAEEPVELLPLTGWELVHYFAQLYGVDKPEPRMTELFHALDLWDARHALAHDYSHGMRQKLSLIRALVHEPSLLI